VLQVHKVKLVRKDLKEISVRLVHKALQVLKALRVL
jgi:hypothetical protein